MNAKVNPEMIILAREAQGLTQKELAEALSLTPATVSRYESSLIEVPLQHVRLLADVLKRPESFFFWGERLYGASCFYHRKLKSLSARELNMIHARVNLLRMQAARLLRRAKVRTSYTFHRLEAGKYGGPEGCAQRLRQLWQMPTGPVRNVVNAVESAGGVVFRCSLGTEKADGISQWPLDAEGMPPVFFVRDGAPGDRTRRTLCHEIGHVVMHHVPTDDPEEEADRFASEFLMPATEIRPELSNLTLTRAVELKGYWKVSMQSIIVHAHRLGKISQDQYEKLFRQIYAKKYHRCEPLPIAAEEPALFAELLRLQCTAFKRSVKEAGEYIGELEDAFRTDYWHSLGGLRFAL
jgi:Zn-dependent peptidase ImmA (M78 family)/transcriptional regulator with XRE-family HTH domain